MSFNERLMELRKSHGLSQEELGYKLGVTRQTVSKWETGQTTPEMDKLVALSALFNISIDELAGNEKATEEPAAPFSCHRAYHFEYKSERTLFGLPLVHINVGRGIYKAKGIIAVGTIARGIISLGAISLGVVSLGALSLGLLALGALALGLFAAGGFAFGAIAAGGISVGALAFGGVAVGKYSIGGFASASDIAMGGFAQGHIAIGDSAKGDYIWAKIADLGPADYANIEKTILREYPGISRWIADLFV